MVFGTQQKQIARLVAPPVGPTDDVVGIEPKPHRHGKRPVTHLAAVLVVPFHYPLPPGVGVGYYMRLVKRV